MQKSQSELLKEYKSTLSNAQHHPLISAAIAQVGYDATKVSEAVKMLNDTVQVTEDASTISEEKEKASHDYSNKKKAVSDLFRLHRRKIKSCSEIKDLQVTCEKCASILISGRVPKHHKKWVEMMQSFYSNLQNEETLEHIKASGITNEIATNCLKEIDAMETMKEAYESGKTKYHDAINKKQTCMKDLSSWIKTFQHAVGSVLKENKMHLEALSIDPSNL